MKPFLASLILFLSTAGVNAQQNQKPVMCLPMDMYGLTSLMRDKFEAVPMFSLDSDLYTDVTKIVMFGNAITGKWMIMEVFGNTSCLLAGGTAPAKPDGVL